MESKLYQIILAAVFTITIYSCTPKYFRIEPDEYMFQELMQLPSLAGYTKYNFTLVPYDYFKKNKLTTALLSDSSIFLKNNLLFHLDSRENYLNQGESYLNSSWFRMDAFFENQEQGFKEGQNFILRTISGKTQEWGVENKIAKIEEGKLMYVFKGHVGPTLPLQSQVRNQTMIYIDQVWKISRDKIEEPKKIEKVLAMLVEDHDNFIKVNAVIDINFKRRSEKPIVYDINNIFGESIWMNKTVLR